MLPGERICRLREAKGVSQKELERRSGLLRCYIERVEHGHTVPSLETLERLAWALDVPLYRLFYDEGDSDAQQLEYFSRLEHALRGQRGWRGLFRKFRAVFQAVNEQFPSRWDAVLFYALALLMLIWITAHIVRF
jgi:transcriptional regulator with XRE-family HTH domain